MDHYSASGALEAEGTQLLVLWLSKTLCYLVVQLNGLTIRLPDFIQVTIWLLDKKFSNFIAEWFINVLTTQ